MKKPVSKVKARAKSSGELLPGTLAPEFALKDKDGVVLALKEVHAKHIVVYFYPKDNTPGCTIEAQRFNEALAELRKQKVVVIGISGGNEKSKTKFCSAYDLQFPLLSDPDFSVAKAYAAYGEKSFMGRKFKGIFRKTFLLDKEHRIVKVYEKVKPDTHAREILKDLQGNVGR